MKIDLKNKRMTSQKRMIFNSFFSYLLEREITTKADNKINILIQYIGL